MTEFSLPIKVYLEDTDAGGIVYHVNYLKYMERSRTDFLGQLGYDKPAILAGGLLLVVHSMEILFAKPSILGEALQATAKVKKLARSYVVFEQKVRRGDETLCEATVKVACISRDQHRPKPMPQVMQAFLREHLDQGSAE